MAGIKIVSERLKEIRTNMGLNQADFAALIGVTQQSLSGYEKCTSKPTLDVAMRIAEKCDISLSWLCGLTDRVTNNKLFRTYTDIIDIFFDIMNIAHLDVYTASIQKEDCYGEKQLMWGVLFTDEYLNEFISDWNKMRTLYSNGTIDNEVYSLWREKTIKKYKLPIKPEITEYRKEESPEPEAPETDSESTETDFKE